VGKHMTRVSLPPPPPLLSDRKKESGTAEPQKPPYPVPLAFFVLSPSNPPLPIPHDPLHSFLSTLPLPALVLDLRLGEISREAEMETLYYC
jgi:hypothetical protein